MYIKPETYPYNYYYSLPMYNPYNMYQCPYFCNMPMNYANYPMQVPSQYTPYSGMSNSGTPIKLKDYGSKPFVVNIDEATKQNSNFRIALWTGEHLQVTLMSIKPGQDIGLEIHPCVDQFIRIEQGQGLTKMGKCKDNLDFQRKVFDDYAIMIPAGYWHNLINTGNEPLKLYSIYAPPEHPKGTVHKTKADAIAAEQSEK